MASSSAPDQELKAAFAELQSKMVENKQKIKFHDLQIENLKRSITHSTLTDTEITQLPKETKVRVERRNPSHYNALRCVPGLRERGENVPALRHWSRQVWSEQQVGESEGEDSCS